jgi:hypothetical protein
MQGLFYSGFLRKMLLVAEELEFCQPVPTKMLSGANAFEISDIQFKRVQTEGA